MFQFNHAMLHKYSQQKTPSCTNCCARVDQILNRLITILLSYADTEFICCKALSEVALCLENMKERNSIEFHTGGENAFSHTLGQFFIIVNWEYREMEAANKIQLWIHWHWFKAFHCFDFPPYTNLSNPYTPKAAWSQLKGYIFKKHPTNLCFI